MSACKKVMVNLSKITFDKFNKVVQKDSSKRSKFIEETVILYSEEEKRLSYEEMKNGYIQMAELNLELSQCGFTTDMSDLDQYETILSESDLPDDDTDSEKRRYILC